MFVCGLVALAAVALLGVARRWRLAASWCALFGGAMLLVIGSKLGFIGWGIGIESLNFCGFSGHAARAAAVFPVAFFLMFEAESRRMQNAGVLFAIVCAMVITYSRIAVGAHPLSEALSGFSLGLLVAVAFIVMARREAAFRPSAWIVGSVIAVLTLAPRGEFVQSESFMVPLAIYLSGNDHPYLRSTWQRKPTAWAASCPPDQIFFDYSCFPKGTRKWPKIER
ncbi:MAG: phosphatase PAP2 family protein [Pseudomonadota bacterium]